MTDADREIKRLISYIRSCREANIDCTVTIDKRLTHCVLNALEEVQKYREIGTVEECREAVAKQKPKRAVLRNDNGKLRKSCPVCGCFYSPLSRSCPKCGQAIQRDKNLEGAENEN